MVALGLEIVSITCELYVRETKVFQLTAESRDYSKPWLTIEPTVWKHHRQYRKSFHLTHPFILVRICIKYDKDQWRIYIKKRTLQDIQDLIFSQSHGRMVCER